MNWRTATFHDAIQETYIEEFSKNEDRILIGEDIEYGFPEAKITLPLLKEKFPDRVLNQIPLIEEMLPGVALGAYLGGLRPIVQFNWETFITVALDQLYRLGIWRYRMAETVGPGVIVRVGHDAYDAGGPELSASLLGILFHLPNIKIVTPVSAYFAKGLLRTAFQINDPVVFIEHKKLYEKEVPVLDGEYRVPLGSSFIFRPGKDLTIITWMFGTIQAMDAAEILAEEKIDVEVLSLQTLVPMDMRAIFGSVEKTGKAVIFEEDMLRGGIGAEIVARISEELPGVVVKRLASQNVPTPSHPQYLRSVMPTKDKLIEVCKELVMSN